MDKEKAKDVQHTDVQDFYAGGRLKAKAPCTATECRRYSGKMGELMRQIHPEVSNRYYGCGLVAPDELLGLDVLDLGCGVGVDVFLLANLVGASGHVTGIDMTDEQLDVARKYEDFHSKLWGYTRHNTSFCKGYIEDLKSAGVDTASQDVVVSNCVLNLSMKKEDVLRETARVLRAGGEFYFSDMYSNKPNPEELRADAELWGECFAGALHWEQLVGLAREAGFCQPVLFDAEPIHYQDTPLLARIPKDMKYVSATYRLFKRAEGALQDDVDAVMRMTYIGGLAKERFQLTSSCVLDAGESLTMSKQLAGALALSRYGKYLRFEKATDGQDTSKGVLADCDPFTAR